jgi:dihydroorotase
MTSLLIAGGRIVDPATSVDALCDLRVRDGAIAEIGERLEPVAGETVLDAADAIVAPGFIDMHVHLREPGFPEKETLETGTAAAVRGGFTAVACMPNTQPALDEPATIAELIAAAQRRAHCRVYPVGAITKGRWGSEPCDYRALAAAGAVAFSDDGDTVHDVGVLRDAALRALGLSAPFISHCEDRALKNAPDGPAIAEDVAVARDLLIAADTGKAWHIAHVSTAGSLDLIRYVRGRGARVTCEVTPHHLTFTNESARHLGHAAAVNPPLRAQHDVDALRDGVRDGTIDVLATDHAPHTAQEKSGAANAVAPGFSGLEIALGAYAAALADLPIARLVAMLATNPASILHLAGGTLRVGAPADITIVDRHQWVVDPRDFASKGRCTPFAGWQLTLRARATIVGGAIRYDAERS